MPGKPKSGPPYTDTPPGSYIVITNPWGMSHNIRDRSQLDANRVAAWAQLVLKEATGSGRVPSVECVYGMGTRDEIIVQFPQGTDIAPLLGEHHWAAFSRISTPDDPHSSCIFAYNWLKNGDPANRECALLPCRV
ncbi:hypothetical protein HYDPIDRAFT_112927 [Hydnomerulius pinastri MD-312]|uniref:Unplaced genomic scaffold scaffold_16, whole genome shotgun sequence n=1 Tax=Hydnomerulius pinastri MD-312 TaxID=994086 RepID=A0A0C9W803_9AGAM|nr:hypothetical protein HYDPIDRAFT_112927 [Hydnomerulius pinastri MD-312]